MEHPTRRATANQRVGGVCAGPTAAGRGLAQPFGSADVVESGGSGLCTRNLLQPWRRFWPPVPGSDTYKKLETEHPDVLTWRFDNSRPFDRPWRHWTGPAPVEGGGLPPGPLLNGFAGECLPQTRWRQAYQSGSGGLTVLCQLRAARLVPTDQPRTPPRSPSR